MPMPVYSILFNATKLQKKFDYLSISWRQSALFCAEKKECWHKVESALIFEFSPYANGY